MWESPVDVPQKQRGQNSLLTGLFRTMPYFQPDYNRFTQIEISFHSVFKFCCLGSSPNLSNLFSFPMWFLHCQPQIFQEETEAPIIPEEATVAFSEQVLMSRQTAGETRCVTDGFLRLRMQQTHGVDILSEMY